MLNKKYPKTLFFSIFLGIVISLGSLLISTPNGLARFSSKELGVEAPFGNNGKYFGIPFSARGNVLIEEKGIKSNCGSLGDSIECGYGGCNSCYTTYVEGEQIHSIALGLNTIVWLTVVYVMRLLINLSGPKRANIGN